jgi:hypothetical protein
MTYEDALNKIKEVSGAFKPNYTPEDSEHWYVHTQTGLSVPSVTTVSSILEKKWIVKWKIKEAVSYILTTEGDVLSEKDMDRVLESSYLASEKKVLVAQTVGTIVHDTIEKWFEKYLLEGKRPTKTLVSMYQPKFVIDQTTHLKYNTTQTQVIAALRSAQSFIDKHDARPLALEICVGDVKYGYAGKLDALMWVDGKIEIWDWKTSNVISLDDPTYPIQINAYRKAFEDMTGLSVEKQKIIQLSKHEDRFTWYEVEKSDDLLQAFYGLLTFYGKRKGKHYQEIYREA